MSRSVYSDEYLQHAKENRLRIDRMRLIEDTLLKIKLEEKELESDKKLTTCSANI